MKNVHRSSVALIFTLMLLLSGCLNGNGDSTEGRSDGGIIQTAQGSTVTTIVDGNYLPLIHVTQASGVEEDVAWAWENETTTTTTTSPNGTTTNTTEVTSSFYNGTLIGATLALYHAAMDPEGTTMTMGWDFDLDGVIDLPVTSRSGITSTSLPLNILHMTPNSSAAITTIAFVAEDAVGDSSVALLNIYTSLQLGPWYEDHTEYPGLYAFTGADAEGAANAPSSATNDTLIKLTMTQGSDLNWAYMSVKLTTNAGDIYFCSSPNAAEGAACQLVDNGRDTTDATMSVGDVVTIVETDTDICSTSCTMDVEITNTRTDEVIDRIASVIAE